MNTRTASGAMLAGCALSDLAAVWLLLGSDDGLVAVGRAIDILGALPAVTAGVGAAGTSADAVTVGLSVLAIVSLVRINHHAVRTAYR
jgi:hypothetical protein